MTFDEWLEIKSKEIEQEIDKNTYCYGPDVIDPSSWQGDPAIWIPDPVEAGFFSSVRIGSDISLPVFNFDFEADWLEEDLGYRIIYIQNKIIAAIGNNRVILFFDPYNVKGDLSQVLDMLGDFLWQKEIKDKNKRPDDMDPILEKVSFAYKANQEKEKKRLESLILDEEFKIKKIQKELKRKQKEKENIEKQINDDITKHPEVTSFYELLTDQGVSFTTRGDIIRAKIPTFEIKGQSLGPLMIEYQSGSRYARVKAAGDCPPENFAITNHYHPHVDTDGSICYGTAGVDAQELFRRPFVNPFEVIFFVTNFLKTGYYAPGSYKKVEFWDRADGWECHTCNDWHERDQPCPHQCRLCSNSTADGTHKICEVHSMCFNSPDYCEACKGLLSMLVESPLDVDGVPDALKNEEEITTSISCNPADRNAFLYIIEGKFAEDSQHTKVYFKSDEYAVCTSARAPEFALARWPILYIYERSNPNSMFSLKFCRDDQKECSIDSFEMNPLPYRLTDVDDDVWVVAIYESNAATFAPELSTKEIAIDDELRLVLYSNDPFYGAITRPVAHQRPLAIYYKVNGEYRIKSFDMSKFDYRMAASSDIVEQLGFKDRLENGIGLDPAFVMEAMNLKPTPPKEKRIKRTRNTKRWKLVKKIIEFNYDRAFFSAIQLKALPDENNVLMSIERSNPYHLPNDELRESHNKFMSAPADRRLNYVMKYFDEKGL